MAQVRFGNMPCQPPAEVAQFCHRHGLPTSSFLGRANSYTCGLGEEPGKGTVLLHRKHFQELSLADTHDFEFRITKSEFHGAGRAFTSTLKGMVIRDAQSVTPGVEDDEMEILAVHFEDSRCLYQNVPVNVAYNVRRQSDAGYYDSTLTGGLVWTWLGMVQSLWTLVGKLGDFPGLPFTPHGQPSDIQFWGGKAWKALCEVLTRIGCAARYNPLTGLVDIVRVGQDTQDVEQALLNYYDYRVHDNYWTTSARGNVPEKVRVLFRKLPPPDHTGESPWHQVLITNSLGLTGIESGTAHDIYDDVPARYDGDGNLLNLSEVTLRAQERASDYFRTLATGLDRVDILFGAPLSDTRLIPGGLITQVTWQDLQGSGQERNICTRVRRLETFPRVRFPKSDRQETRRVRVVDGEEFPGGLVDAWTLNRDFSLATWVDDFPCWVIETQGNLLEPGEYNAQYLGYYGGRAVYSVTCCGGARGSGSGSGSGSGESGSGPEPPTEGCGPVVRVVSGQKLQFDFMDGFLTSWSGQTRTHSDYQAAWVIELNGNDVPPGWYVAQCLDVSEGRMVYGINHCCGEGSGSGPGSSGPDEVLVACCPYPVPNAIEATITDKTGDCSCLPDSAILGYLGDGIWESDVYEDCGGTCYWRLSCIDGQWDVTIASCVGSFTVVSVDCEDFEVVVDVDNTGMSNCTGTFRITFRRPA